MIDARIADGDGNKRHAAVDDEGALQVVVHPHPPRGESGFALPVRQRFADVAGSTDMAVDGSSTSVPFYVPALVDFDVYIKFLSVVIGDGGTPALNKFGALTALSVGVGWQWESQNLGSITLHDGIKTNLEFVRIGSATAGIGTGTDAFLADVSGGGTEKSYLPSIDLSQLYGLPYGIRLRKGTNDKMIFRVRDNLSGLTTFNIIAYGLKIQ